MLCPKGTCIVVLTLAICLGVPSLSRADAVTDWNQIAIPIIAGQVSHPGATSLLDSAMVQAAVYAAVAKAARDVLVNRFPSLAGGSLDTTYHQYLANRGILETDPGVAVGAAAAAAIIAFRANDGSFPNCIATPPPPLCDFAGGDSAGEWRPTLPAFAHMLAPWLSSVEPFTLKSPFQFRPVAPPPLTSKRYATDYNEVKALGAATNSARTTDQTNLALFYFTNYQVMWNRAVRDIAAAHETNIDDSARLFALVNLAMTDAV